MILNTTTPPNPTQPEKTQPKTLWPKIWKLHSRSSALPYCYVVPIKNGSEQGFISFPLERKDRAKCHQLFQSVKLPAGGGRVKIPTEESFAASRLLLDTAITPASWLVTRGKQHWGLALVETSPQAKRHKPSLLFTSLTIITFLTR